MDQEEGKWSPAFSFDEEDEALSLSDLPVSTGNQDKSFREKDQESLNSVEAEEFEFRTWGSKGLCAADDVFFKGQILPLMPSISSDTGVFVVPSRYGSRLDSMDCIPSLVFDSSGRSSSSSSRSSSCISRSQSSSSSEAPRHSISSNFYAHPSPRPQIRRANAGRKSTGSAPAGWSLFRLGLVQAPEIEIHNLRARRSVANVNESITTSSTSTSIGSRSFREVWSNCSTVVKPKRVGDQTASGKREEMKKAPLRFFGLGFACKCSPDSVDQKQKKHNSRVLVSKSSDKKRGESLSQRRIFEWLEELTVARMMM